FAYIKSELAVALEDAVLAIEHVGSTAVPGLAAKPVIDIDVVIATLADFPLVRTRLESIGYRHEGDLGIPGREAFKYEDKRHLMKHHLYVCTADAAELKRHLAFRDHLRTHADDREAYGAVKRAAALRHPEDIEGYMADKADLIAAILARTGRRL
ncbi:MAG: GrpB family protein, partial [Bacillota bacterium]|nr:GrpB family protein [Bacillota bacterium]